LELILKITKSGTTYDIQLEGAIGESSPIFNHDVRDATVIQIDGSKMTYINSIGVKNWIMWTVRVPAQAKFILRNLPLVMVSQASMVKGFLPKHARIESFFAPFVCAQCEAESTILLNRGTDYEYPSPGIFRKVNLPQATCAKCQGELEPDFLEIKTFQFLNEI
jgi:hypothetical protein